MLVVTPLAAWPRDALFYDDFLVLLLNLQVHCRELSAHDELIVEAVQVVGVQFDSEGLLAINDDVFEVTFQAILRIELQVSNHVTEQDTRLDDFYLVLQPDGLGHEA